jgi:hypothetical protein
VTENRPDNTEPSAAPELALASTAFLVAWINGEVIVTADLNAPIMVHHDPTADEILGAGAVLVADRTAERTASLSAQTTVATIENKQKQAMAKMQAAQAEAMLAAEQKGRQG